MSYKWLLSHLALFWW